MFGAVKSPTGFHLDDDEKKLKKMGILDSPRQRPYGYRPKRVFFPMSMVTRRTLTVGVIASFILFIFLSSHGTFSHHPPSQSPYHGHSSGHSFGSSDGKYPASGSKGSRHGASTPGTLATAPGTAPPPLPQEEEQDAFARLMNFTVTDRPVMVDDPLCEGFPDIGNIAVIMKTGASESFGKIPTQLLTTMRCVPELLIFSDKEETIAGVKIRNALDNMLPEAQKNNGEFDLYRAQRDCLVDQEHCTKHIKNKGDAGWNLDKYKNIHMAEKTWKLRPGRDWYFFIDADTYVLWNTLVLWLQKLDPARKHYLGNIALIQDFAFAHGGSGYLLSRPALAELVAKNPGVAHEYDVLMKDVCCGDYMFSRAMKEKTGIAAVQVWPTLNRESFWSVQFGPWLWCNPMATLHHMSAEEVSLMWEWETKRYATPSSRANPDPILLRDIYHAFVEDRMVTPLRHDWDNLSDDRVYYAEPGEGKSLDDWSEEEKNAHKSAEDCRKACEANKDCYQWNWGGAQCAISWTFRVGNPMGRDSKGRERKTSGWMLERIQSFIKTQDCGKKVDWKMEAGLL